MSKVKNIAVRTIGAVIITFAFFLLSNNIAGYGLTISAAISLLFFPPILAILCPKEVVRNFYGRHLQLITLMISLALPAVLTFVLYGFLGILLLFEIPILFFIAPPLLALLLTEIGVLVLHRILAHKIIAEEKYPKHILRTSRMLDRMWICVFVSFFSLIGLLYLLAQFQNTLQFGGYLLWLLAYVFWLYFLLIPISILFVRDYKIVRLGLKVALDSVRSLESIETDSEIYKRKVLCDLAWLKDALIAYNRFLFKMPGHPMLASVNNYYEAAYLAVSVGTKGERKKLRKSLEDMFEALGNEKKENNFRKFTCALIRITKTGRITWKDLLFAVKTGSRTERIIECVKSILIYLPPILSLIVSIAVELLRPH